LPKFYDLSTDANAAAVKGVAGGLSSAGSVNYGVRSIHPLSGVATTGAATCQTLAADPNFMTGDITGYTIGGALPNCTVTRNGVTANAYIPAIN
jgi:hypothetical protein